MKTWQRLAIAGALACNLWGGVMSVGAQPAVTETPQLEAMDPTAVAELKVRLAEIDVHPAYWEEYLTYARNVARASIVGEPGVIIIYPMVVPDRPYHVRILEMYRNEEAYTKHINSAHFQAYKQGTLHMVKSLTLLDMTPLAPEVMPLVLKKW